MISQPGAVPWHVAIDLYPDLRRTVRARAVAALACSALARITRGFRAALFATVSYATLASLTRIFRCAQNCLIHAIQAAAKDVRRDGIGAPGVKSIARRKRGSTTDAIDCHVGSRIRERRITLGLTRRQLGKMIGLTVPQIHKYECGFNRVSAGKLFEIACALSAPITYFFEDTGQEGPQQITLRERMLLNVVRNVAKIRNEQQREAVRELVRALAST